MMPPVDYANDRSWAVADIAPECQYASLINAAHHSPPANRDTSGQHGGQNRLIDVAEEAKISLNCRWPPPG